MGSRPDDVPAPTQITAGALWDLATTQPAGGAPDKARIFLRHYELTQEYHSVSGGMFVHPLASPKAVRPLDEIMLYAVSRDLLMDFVQDPKRHWNFTHPSECAPHVALLLVGTRNLLNGCVDHFMGMVYVSGVQERLLLADAVQTLLAHLDPIPQDGESEVLAFAVLVGVRHFPPWLCPADPATAFCTFGGNPNVSHAPLVELQGGLLRTVGVLTNSDIWPCCVVVLEMLNGGVMAIVSRTPPGCFSNAPVGYQQFCLRQGELPVMMRTAADPGSLVHLELDFLLVPPFDDRDKETRHVRLEPRNRMAFTILSSEQPVYDGAEAAGFQLMSTVVSEEYGTLLAPVVSGICKRARVHLCEFLKQCSEQRSLKLAAVQERHTEASQGVVDLLNKLLIDLRSKQEPNSPFALAPVSTESSLVTRTTPERQDRQREPAVFSASRASSKIRSLAKKMVSRGFNQCRTLDKEVSKDEVAAATLDSVMQMEQVRACHLASQAKGGELSRLETAIVAFRSAVGRRLSALDLCPTASPTSDSENPFVEQLRSAVAKGCEDAASLEAAVHLERNARSALQNLPVSRWKEALEGAFRASPNLVNQPVKDAIAEVSPKVILALLRRGSEQVGPVGLLESALKEDAGRQVLSSVVPPLMTARLPKRAQLYLEGEAGRALVEGVVWQVTQVTLDEASSNVESLKVAMQADMSAIHGALIRAVTKELPKLLPTSNQAALDATRAELSASIRQVDERLAQEAAALRAEIQVLRENRGLITPLMSPPRPGVNIPSFSPATSLHPVVPPGGSQASGGCLVAPPSSVPSTPLGYARRFSSTKRPGSDRGVTSQGVKHVATHKTSVARGSSVAVAAPSSQSLPAATQASPDVAREAETSMDITEDTSVAARWLLQAAVPLPEHPSTRPIVRNSLAPLLRSPVAVPRDLSPPVTDLLPAPARAPQRLVTDRSPQVTDPGLWPLLPFPCPWGCRLVSYRALQLDIVPVPALPH